jgi:hypothetical protein
MSHRDSLDVVGETNFTPVMNRSRDRQAHGLVATPSYSYEQFVRYWYEHTTYCERKD